ncbi:MAG: glycoside hydrolase family 3 C-terminal domain-containing protein [Oscillospiraceae bacterium]
MKTNDKMNRIIEDIISELTIEEKCSLMKYDSPAIERLGIPAMNWWNEGLHGYARGGTATMFPQAIGLASTFDDSLIKKMGGIISDEARAKYNQNMKYNDIDKFKGLTLWSPNINIFRDARWGRGQETYGECPYLTGVMGKAFVEGIQGDDDGYIKAAACVKHFAAHSGPEGERHGFNAEVSMKDLHETYLPAFRKIICETDVAGVMGAYNSINGEACCASEYLNNLLRNEWNFNGYFVSDCGAVDDIHTSHHITENSVESAALAINNGCNVNCGVTYLYAYQAYKDGLISEEKIDDAVRNILLTRLSLDTLGEKYKNPNGENPYNSIPYDIVDSREHNELSRKIAEKSMVMLKNNGILPIDKSRISRIAVIGPQADSRMVLKGNYYGTPSKTVTFLEGIRNEFENYGRVFYSEGCHMLKDRVESIALPDDRIGEALTIAELSDVSIICVGYDSTVEGEDGDTENALASGDKLDIRLPEPQRKLIKAIEKLNKPFIIVLSSGSAVNVESEKASAIIQTWYPGAWGGIALADILFGRISPSGKLPVTFYEKTELLPDFRDYSMKNRTYRYAENNVLYPFGYGLTYSKMKCSNMKIISADLKNGIDLSINIENIGEYDTDEILQIYIKDNASKYAVKNHKLCGFKRIHLKQGENMTVDMHIEPCCFEVVDDDGRTFVDSDDFTLYAGISQPDELSCKLTGMECLSSDIKF